MIISKLSLQNFRSYSKSEFNFSQGINVIVGPNTIGKTNILESIFMLGTGKSFRAQKDEETVRFGAEVGRVIGEIHENSGHELRQKLEIVLTKGMVGTETSPKKKYLLNGVNKRLFDFSGVIKCVLFAPTDLELITNSPSLRRRYLDFVLLQVDTQYHRAFLSYEKGLRQRNKLLARIRDEGISRSQLAFWDELLINNGNIISKKREEFINYLNHEPKEVGDYKITYDQSVISQDRLQKYSREEVASAMTLVGPHRDDWKIDIQKTENSKQITNRDLDVALFGSRGEQRMAILWLKMGEISFVSTKTNARPVLLLDDIFSELDENHRKLIMKIIPKQQTIITTTDLDHIGKEFLGKVNVIELMDNNLLRRQ